MIVQGQSDFFKVDHAMPLWDIFQGLDSLTNRIQQDPPVYGLVSSGGAAGGVVSESQGYALLVTGTVLAAWDTYKADKTEQDRQAVVTAFEGYFNGWKKMCQNSNRWLNCQIAGKICRASDGTTSVCLPGWKHSEDLSQPWGFGSAPDGDEDAIMGMILALRALEQSGGELPTWYDELYSWIDASVWAFMRYNTVRNRSGEYRILKLGSCWGGWSQAGQNPSYYAPGAYKMMRDFQKRFPDDERSYKPYSIDEWNKLIRTSYDVLRTVQCPAIGMIPNWARIRILNGTIAIEPGRFSGSGTPQYEFGAEAARTIWRLAVDAVLYPDETYDGPAPLLEPIIDVLNNPKWTQRTFAPCTTPGMDRDIYIHDNWLRKPFIYGPVLSSLVLSSTSRLRREEQTALVERAGDKLRNSVRDLPSSFYPRCWILLSNLIVLGAMESAASVLTDDSVPTPQPVFDPTDRPTSPPTRFPTDSPTSEPTQDPTSRPTRSPTDSPTQEPTVTSTRIQSRSSMPTNDQTTRPTPGPYNDPTDSPTLLSVPSVTSSGGFRTSWTKIAVLTLGVCLCVLL